MMKAQFFSHKECEYYPCHEGVEELNCLFCYCPFFLLEDCPGNPEWKVSENDGVRRKSCAGCTFPHRKENYPEIIRNIKEKCLKRKED